MKNYFGFLTLLIGLAFANSALAQSSPHLYNGQQPSNVQWNSYFAAKQDYPVPPFTTTQSGSVPISPGGTTAFLRADGTWAVPGAVILPGDPTATIGSTPVNGVATTYMRSDAAPKLPAVLPALDGSQLTNLTINNLSGLGTGVATALTQNVSGTGAICLVSGSACSGTPGGSSGQMQWNSSGSFAGVSGSSCNASFCTLTGYVLSSPSLGGSVVFSGITGSTQCLQVNSSGIVSGTGSACGGGGGVTTTGSPANGNLTKFSGASTITNGDLSGDCTTSGTLVVTCPSPIAKINVNNSWTAAQRGTPVTLSLSTATATPNFDTGQNFSLTLSSACPCTFANPSTTPVAGQTGVIVIIQDATGGRTIGTWGSNYITPGGVSVGLALSTAANARDYFSYYVDDSTHIVITPGALNAIH